MKRVSWHWLLVLKSFFRTSTSPSGANRQKEKFGVIPCGNFQAIEGKGVWSDRPAVGDPGNANFVTGQRMDPSWKSGWWFVQAKQWSVCLWMGRIADRHSRCPKASSKRSDQKAQRTVMFYHNGDNERVAQAIAKQVGIDTVIADVLPQESQRHPKLQEASKVAFVGDGITMPCSDRRCGDRHGSNGDIAIESAASCFTQNDGWLKRRTKNEPRFTA